MDRAVRVGITGKIGSGKSTLAEIMRSAGLIVINTDVVAKELMRSDDALRTRITALLGSDAYQDGELNRAFVAARIFSETRLRKELEAVVHPAVRKQIEYVFRNSPAGKPVCVESALILQSDFYKMFDYIIVVDAPDDVVFDRLTKEGKFSDSDVRQRLREQNYDDLSQDEADFTLENTGTAEQFEARAKALTSLITILSNRDLPAVPLHQIEEEE